MTQVISPTPGRIVWYFPAPHDGIGQIAGQPLAAIVAAAHHDRLVNLAVFDAYGNAQQRSNVTLVQPDEDLPSGAFAAWMPYQVKAATKAEQLQPDAHDPNEPPDAAPSSTEPTTSNEADLGENTEAPAA